METADQTGAARVATLRCPRPPRPPVRRSHSRSETGSRPPTAPALHHPPSPVTAPPTAPTTRSYTTLGRETTPEKQVHLLVAFPREATRRPGVIVAEHAKLPPAAKRQLLRIVEDEDQEAPFGVHFNEV